VPRLFMLTLPGLNVASDWAGVPDRLLDDFPAITDVLATTMTATLLIVYEGDTNVDGWLEGIRDGILSGRIRDQSAPRVRTQSRPRVRTQSRARSRARDQHRAWGLRRARDRAP
jgi:hypothetical protein